MEEILNEVMQERIRQNEKWGEQNHNPVEWISILLEEVGEASKEALNYYFKNPAESHLEKELAESKGNLLAYNRLQNYRNGLKQFTNNLKKLMIWKRF